MKFSDKVPELTIKFSNSDKLEGFNLIHWLCRPTIQNIVEPKNFHSYFNFLFILFELLMSISLNSYFKTYEIFIGSFI